MSSRGAGWKPSKRRRQTIIALFFAGLVLSSAIGGLAVGTDFLDGFYDNSGGVTYNASGGPQVTIEGDHNFQSGNPFSGSTFVAKTEANGEVEFSAPDGGDAHQPAATVHVSGLTGEWTNVSGLNVSTHALTINPGDKQQVTVEGDTDTFAFRGMQADDGNVDFAYSGTSGGETNVTIHDLDEPANTRVAAVDTSGSILDSAYVDSSGTLTLQGLPQSSHTVELESQPDNLTVYNESAPENVVDDRELNAQFFDLNGDKITEASTTNGVFELDELDDSEFAVRITDSQGDYADRQVIIKDITRQQSAYILNTNTSVQTVQPTFQIDDETGNYDPTTSRVYIERGLNISNSTTYQTIAAEEVGTDGYTETIEAEQRYRIIVENQDGDRRVLGKFSASDSNTYTLTVEELTFDLGADEGAVRWGFNHTAVENGDDYVHFRYDDAEEKTDSLEVIIYERGNKSNELHNETYGGPIGTISIKEPIPAAHENAEWAVEWNADRGTGQSAKWLAGPLGSVPLPTSDRLVHTIAVGFILLVGGLASQVNSAAVGFTVAGTAGIAYYIGWLPGSVAGGMIALAFAIPLMYLVQSEGGLR